MAHPLHHAESSARRFGGQSSDYQAIHDWFDATKEHMAFFTHRAGRHNTMGIFEAERLFDTAITNSAGRVVPVRFIGEQHVKEDCQVCIPTLVDWLGRIAAAARAASSLGSFRTSETAQHSRARWSGSGPRTAPNPAVGPSALTPRYGPWLRTFAAHAPMAAIKC